MTLDKYLELNKETAKDFATRAKVSESLVCRVRKGHTPKLKAARAIEKATGGKVRL